MWQLTRVDMNVYVQSLTHEGCWPSVLFISVDWRLLSFFRTLGRPIEYIILVSSMKFRKSRTALIYNTFFQN